MQNSHFIFATPFGDAAVLYREKPFSMIRTVLPRENIKKIMSAAEWGIPGSNKNARAISEQISNYFKGKAIRIPWERMDMGTLTELEKYVLMTVAEIPYGETRTYKAVAESIGRHRAYRFVGTTLAKNPFPILIPCHRVIRSDLSVGKFGGGTELKQKMIELEAEFKEIGAERKK